MANLITLTRVHMLNLNSYSPTPGLYMHVGFTENLSMQFICTFHKLVDLQIECCQIPLSSCGGRDSSLH